MKKIVSICVLFYLNLPSVFSQENLDFSELNFNNWELFIGSDYTEAEIPATSFTINSSAGRHSINTINNVVNNTGDLLFCIPEGEQYSARIGYDEPEAKTEKMVYSYTVGESSEFLYYKYALVLEDGGNDHINIQSKFIVTVFVNGEELACASNIFSL